MQRLTRGALARPALTLVTIGLVSALAALGAVQLRSETGYRAALGSRHPEVTRLDRFIQDFGGGFPVIVAWSCEPPAPCSRPLDDRALEMADELATRLAAIRGVRRVLSPTTMPIFDGQGEARFLSSGSPDRRMPRS